MRYNNYFVLDGKASSDFNLLISGVSTWGSTEYNKNEDDLPYRNGTIINKLGKYKDFKLPYEDCYITKDFKHNYPNFRAWMLAHANKYYRLEDTYHDKEFLLASFDSTLDVDYDAYNDSGKFTVNFNCMPQRWLKIGEQTKTYTQSGTIVHNPTFYESKPLIRVYGKGNLKVGDVTVTIASSYPNSYIDLDSDIYDAYYGDTNCNKYITTTNYDFPTLAGDKDTTITWDSTISKIELTPRWWTL